ncbi:MAG: hypothetical protein RBU30_17010 [Polyangia bacterium]|jgi:hypothetical protein|nr:hypothetical protein [Polyangia bacterium]
MRNRCLSAVQRSLSHFSRVICLGALIGGAPACSDDDDDQHDAHVPRDAAGDASATDAGDAGPCVGDGALNEACDDDCDCQAGLACRGLPGGMSCQIPCAGYDECESAPLGCDLKICELSIGACRCPCQEGDCGDEVCVAGYCVGCASDTDCAGHACGGDPGLGSPRCRLDVGQCVCGGLCGDSVCDPAEEAGLSCPSDCAACTEPEALYESCSDGVRVPYCACDGSGGGGSWDCVDPWDACAGETRCAREGGGCVAAEADCYGGTISATPLGCEGTYPLCCAPEPCTPAGSTHEPWMGRCCPGLRGLPSLSPMTGMVSGSNGVSCVPTCIVLTCAPCGDGICQLHFAENPCNCPEDCPWPPSGFVCDGEGYAGCGRNACRQEGGSCLQWTPTCDSGVCSQEVEVVSGAVCDGVTDRCVAP